MNDLVEKAKRIEGSSRMAKVKNENEDDLAEKIRVNNLILATFTKNQNYVF